MKDKEKVGVKTPDNKFVLGFYKKFEEEENSMRITTLTKVVSESDRHVLRLALRSIFPFHFIQKFHSRILCEFIYSQIEVEGIQRQPRTKKCLE